MIGKIKVSKESENDNDDDDKEQTHDMPNRFRNRASLFVLATWTLGDHVAPKQQVLKVLKAKDDDDNHDDDDWNLTALIGKNFPLPVSLLMFM